MTKLISKTEKTQLKGLVGLALIGIFLFALQNSVLYIIMQYFNIAGDPLKANIITASIAFIAVIIYYIIT